MKVVINRCFGGFGLSTEAYERLIELGVPVRAYIDEPRNPATGLYDIKIPSNEGEIIFDRSISEGEFNDDDHIKFMGRYWDTWTSNSRTHPLIIKVVEELGERANGRHAKLSVVEIPDGVEYTIEDYDGRESIHEVHRSW